MSMSNYVAKIDILLANMSSLKHHVLPANRNAVEEYLYRVWTVITLLTNAFYRVEVDQQLLHRFEDYTQAEERRLLETLKTMRYTIDDAQKMLHLIRESKNVEKVFVFGHRVLVNIMSDSLFSIYSLSYTFC